MTADQHLEAQIAEWRTRVSGRHSIGGDVDELEAHLRDRIDELSQAGLSPDEAFLIAVSRMGALDEVSREFAREHGDRLWKQLVPDLAPRPGQGIMSMLALAVLAGLVFKGLSLIPTRSDIVVGAMSAGSVLNGLLGVLAVLGILFAVRARPPASATVTTGGLFAVAAAALNLYPFAAPGVTWMLAAVHAPIALWMMLGVLYVGGDWRSGSARMDLIRFTGEWVVYYVLLALGGAVLIALTLGLFTAIGVSAAPFVQEWMLPCGAAGAVIVAAWLVEVKQSVIENIAPVLTKVFTPLFTALLLALLIAGIVQGSLTQTDRDLLILFDVTLLIVLGLLLYAMSARGARTPAGWFDGLQLLLLTSALAVDLVVLIAMLTRIGAFGVSANKVASLGLNVILLVNLAGAAVLQLRFLLGRAPFATLERWQTSYLPVYLAWALIVLLVFPPAFGFE